MTSWPVLAIALIVGLCVAAAIVILATALLDVVIGDEDDE